MTVSRLDMVLCVPLFFLPGYDMCVDSSSFGAVCADFCLFQSGSNKFSVVAIFFLSRPACTQLRFNEHVYNVRYAVLGIHAGEL